MNLAIEQSKRAKGFKRIAGVDEAGRGPLAGPVVAAAVVLADGVEPLAGVGDSKALTAELREELFAKLSDSPGVGIGVGIVDVETIDRINILQAALLAMERAVEALPQASTPDFVMVDGPHAPKHLAAPAEPLVKGDSKCYSIAAASIIAKVLIKESHKSLPSPMPGIHLAYAPCALPSVSAASPGVLQTLCCRRPSRPAISERIASSSGHARPSNG